MTEEEIKLLCEGFGDCQWEVGYSTGNMVETVFLKGLAVVDKIDIAGVILDSGKKFLRGMALRGVRNQETGQIVMTMIVPMFIAMDSVIVCVPCPEPPKVVAPTAAQTAKIIGA